MANRLSLPSFMKRTSDPLSPLSDSHKARMLLFEKYRLYYKGHHRQNLKVKTGAANDNVTINWSKKIVNHGVNFLFGQPFSFEIEGDESERSVSEQYLDSVFQDDPLNDFSSGVLWQTMGQNGGVCGTSFLRMYPQDEGKPRLVALDPAIMDIITDPDDITRVNEYHAVWSVGSSTDLQWKRHRVIRDGVEWDIVSEVYNKNHWQEAEPVVRWEYEFAPIFHNQNLIAASEVWGTSDLEDADINDAINFGASNIGRILRYHAHPHTIIKGHAGELSSLDTGVNKLWKINDGEVYNLEMQSDLASSRSNRADLEEAYHQVTDVPRLNPAEVNLGALSGFALRILYGPLLAKTASKQLLYGGTIAKLSHALLLLEGLEASAPVKILWPNPLPTNAVEQSQIFATLATSAGSIEAAAEMAGYTRQQAERLAANDFSGGLRQ